MQYWEQILIVIYVDKKYYESKTLVRNIANVDMNFDESFNNTINISIVNSVPQLYR